MGKYEEKFQEKEVTCPYCNYEFGDSWEFRQDFEDSQECGECGKKFSWNRNIEVSYTSTPNCELNGKEHNYVFNKNIEGSELHICKECNDYKFIRKTDKKRSNK